MKLWQQYGIALSVAWILGVTSYQRYEELPKAKAYATHAYFVCTERKLAVGEKNIESCVESVSRDWDDWMNRKWGRIALLALLPVACGWLLAFAGLFIYRRARPD
jgi:hypothetical protein